MAGPKPVRKAIDPHGWKRTWSRERIDDEEEMRGFVEDYMSFLDHCRTERECVEWMASILREAGFKDIKRKMKARPGQGFYKVNRDREIAFGRFGTCPLADGVNMVAFHLDSPRLDLKPMPIDGDRDTGLGFLRTHYYGGIKKYHWVNIPLTLRGTVHLGDGTTVDVSRENWTLVIPDLEPHLWGKTQKDRKLSEGITGEELIALAAQGPTDEDGERQPVVDGILDALHRHYGITEEDLICSDLCLVPQFEPREIGLDRGLIGAYGQDDRVSAYTALRSVLVTKVPTRCSVAIGFDKEEIGSEGATGAKSAFMDLLLYDLLSAYGLKGTRRELNRTYSRSFCISSDVKSSINPSFKGVQDPQNAARIGSGVTITKYTGSGGKVAANDASAEMVHKLRSVFNSNGIAWQMQETGKVDEGGGGTVAKFLATRNMDVIDMGIPLLSMHSKYEVSSKTDVHMAFKAFSSFFSGLNP